jgi:SAM-dependent methyltransferase
VTVVEIDADLARDLAQRFANTDVEVFEGDATDLDFPDGTFSAAASFSMLHHVPSPALQDDLFAEASRVLRLGGILVATDSLDNPDLRSFHRDDTFVPIDPDDLPLRLSQAGFTDIAIDRNQFAWKAVARHSSATRGKGPAS